jgi:hypothetical protein
MSVTIMEKKVRYTFNALADCKICNCQADGMIFPHVKALNMTPLSPQTCNVEILRLNDTSDSLLCSGQGVDSQVC